MKQDGFKHPIGLQPKWLISEKRYQDIKSAIERFENAGISVPLEWHEELHELSLYLVRREISRKEP